MTEDRSTVLVVRLRMVAAGPDIRFDEDGLRTRSIPTPESMAAGFSALRFRGWAVSRVTLERLRERAARPPLGGFAAPPTDALLGAPVLLDDGVPDGMLRPVYIERIETP